MGLALIIPNISFANKNYGKATLKSGETTPSETPTTPDTPSGGDTPSTPSVDFVVDYTDHLFNSQVATGQNIFSPDYGDWTLIVKFKEDSTMDKNIISAISTTTNSVLSLLIYCLNNSDGTFANFPKNFLYSFRSCGLWAKGEYLLPDLLGTLIDGVGVIEGKSKFALRVKDGKFSHSLDGVTWLNEVNVANNLTETDTQLVLGSNRSNSVFTASIKLCKQALDDVSSYL